MAKRYRSFKRVNLTAKIAKVMVDLLVDRTFKDHFLNRRCSEWASCSHTDSRSIEVARLVESGMTIGAKRAHLDIPSEELDVKFPTAKVLAERLLAFAHHKDVKKVGATTVFLQTAEIARNYAKRSPLERLAECGADLDG